MKHIFKNTWDLNKPQNESCASVIQGAANPRLKVTRCKAHLKSWKLLLLQASTECCKLQTPPNPFFKLQTLAKQTSTECCKLQLPQKETSKCFKVHPCKALQTASSNPGLQTLLTKYSFKLPNLEPFWTPKLKLRVRFKLSSSFLQSRNDTPPSFLQLFFNLSLKPFLPS